MSGNGGTVRSPMKIKGERVTHFQCVELSTLSTGVALPAGCSMTGAPALISPSSESPVKSKQTLKINIALTELMYYDKSHATSSHKHSPTSTSPCSSSPRPSQ
ncbi:hypothetical protein KIL84_010814 [Mauremys mutica]|uniref:Uncharacterized protein n=1 Tax=Mauremys mutica TaxID=74926 RepID=A0A9D3XBU0_9SAUR|nr:hypothetical protein KIL84_010814 [Mauremys mutica]